MQDIFKSLTQNLKSKSDEYLAKITAEINQQSFDENSPLRKLITDTFGKFDLIYVVSVTAILATELANRNEKFRIQRTELLKEIQGYPDELEPSILNMGDATFISPKRIEKTFTKSEIIDLIERFS